MHAWTLIIIADGTLTCTCTQYILSMSYSLGFNTKDYRFRWTLLPHVNAALQGGINVVAARLEHALQFADVVDGGQWSVERGREIACSGDGDKEVGHR